MTTKQQVPKKKISAVPSPAATPIAPPGTRLEYVALSNIEGAKRNPKKHELGQIATSMGRFGYVEPVVIDERTWRLVAGHGRVETLAQLHMAKAAVPKGIKVNDKGEWCIPVVRGWSSKDDKEAEAYLLASNRLSEIGGWDDEALAELLAGLATHEQGLDGIGWSQKEIDALLRSQSEPEVGKTPEEMLASFQAGEIKQVVLYFSAAQYDAVLVRLTALREELEVDSNTDVFLHLLAKAGYPVEGDQEQKEREAAVELGVDDLDPSDLPDAS